jgi:hypothetical protein
LVVGRPSAKLFPIDETVQEFMAAKGIKAIYIDPG